MRRFGPLYAILALAIATLLARLWDVQVTEHDIWAAESVNMVRSHSVEPYVRGAIRDRRGRVLAHDEEVYALDFVWREFRRGHPLGQVAMMRSLANMVPAGLQETSSGLAEAAVAFGSLTPADLEQFAIGGALELPGTDYVPAIAADNERQRRELARTQRRAARAGDLRFYIERMLDLSSRERKSVRELADEERNKRRMFLDLVGQVTGEETQEVRDNLARRVGDAHMRLLKLAGLLDLGEGESAGSFEATLSSGDRLVAIIEERRREVEDEAADALFAIAAGFSARRLDPENLLRFDLDWLAAALDWDNTRLREWCTSRGSIFQGDSLGWIASHAVARAKIGDGLPADRVLSALAHTFRRDPDGWARENAVPQDWRQIEELEILAQLPEHLARGEAVEVACAAPLFDFQLKETQRTPASGEELLAAVLGDVLPAAYVQTEAGPERASTEALLKFAVRRSAAVSEEAREVVSAVASSMHRALQARIGEVLDLAADDGRVSFAPVHVERAMETRRYVVRDRGARSRTIGKEPTIDVVLLVTRYPEAFAGFHATRRSERVLSVMGPDGETPLAPKLLGTVRPPRLVEVLRQRPRMEELAVLRRKLVLPEGDTSRILSLIDASFRPGEEVGETGLEGWFDRELRGRSGVLEVQGLQDRVEGNRTPIYRGARDGEDLVLTLDAELQHAAEGVLMAPEYPMGDPAADRVWFQRPVGAIVLASVTGEVLAAASWPAQPDVRDDEDARTLDGERRYVRERTLGRARGRPPGSVIKPMIAAYALENLALDPVRLTYVCDANAKRQGVGASSKRGWHAGWGDLNCNSTSGHSGRIGGRGVAMHDALCWSCNVYFAGLAERVYDEGSILEVYRTFGFDGPTGVRWSDDGTRSGLREDSRAGDPLFEPAASATARAVQRQRLGNGLSHVNCNPMQVARAYAGLATGQLPEMSLVLRAGGQEIPRKASALPISEQNLELVRNSLRAVVTRERATGHGKGLDEGHLGFTLAAKTGSADSHPGRVPSDDLTRHPSGWKDGMRKHTWVAGWFPADEPRYVVTVLCHDTSATASHSAVYVTRQFLTTTAVQDLMGVER